MTSISRFEALPARDRVLVGLAVILDGLDAAEYLQGEMTRGGVLADVATEISRLNPEVRLCLIGTLFRKAIEEL